MKTRKWADIKAELNPATRNEIEAGACGLAAERYFAQPREAKGLIEEAMEWELVLAARFKDGVDVPVKLNENDRAVQQPLVASGSAAIRFGLHHRAA